MEIVFFILAIIGIWLLAVSFYVFKAYRFFRKLSLDIDRDDLMKTLEKVIADEKTNFQSITEIKKEIGIIEKDSLSHIQKVGFVRFNPFEELGGDHSFSVALLNGKGTGIIITGLHTRERTRVYVKDIKLGKSEVELSHEERKALRLAQREN